VPTVERDSEPPAAALRRSLVFATDILAPLTPLARAAQAASFDRVWTTEYVGRDAVVRALATGLATESIGVGTGIAYAFARPPLAMAAQALDVQRLIGSRFALGLGTGTRGVRRWYQSEFDPAATRFAAYVADLRAAWRRMREDDWPRPPEVYGAGLNPAMLRAVGASSDGVVLHPLAIARIHLHERVLPSLAEGRARVGAGTETLAPLKIAAWCIASIDADEEVARSNARRQLAFYLSTPSYKPVLEGGPWLHVADEVQSAFAAAKPTVSWSELAPLIPDALVDELALTGTESSVADKAARLEAELAELGVHEMVFQTVGIELSDEDTVRNCQAIIDSLGPRLPAPAR
jgi:alkanesulfonate monooxygenase SsuD/methylene tetrahydromethanopterin reductase-like flavin-dependent oxidoreductase (luciferase family)